MFSKMVFVVFISSFVYWYVSIALPSAGYNSVIRQSLHYFSRPGGGRVRSQITDDSAWTGPELSKNTSRWLVVLTDEQQQEIVKIVADLSKQKPLQKVRRGDANWPQWMHTILNKTKHELQSGLGLIVIRGLPVNSLTEEQQQFLFWSLGFEIGIPGAQDDDGNLLGHIRDIGGNPKTERQYKTRSYIPFHNDAADVVGLLCLKSAKKGGTSRVVSSTTVFNKLLERLTEEELETLYQPVTLDTRGSGGVNTFTVKPFAVNEAGKLQTFYHEDYFKSCYEYVGVPPPSDKLLKALDTYNEILAEPDLALDMDFLEGDIQLISNHVTLHSRTEFEDYPEFENRRHLLRLWVSFESDMSIKDRFWCELEKARILSGMAISKAKVFLFGGYGVRR
eukprot:TRINITY_DN3454_c0_g2_i1.p1 TRINITY_DN3454_c0_g2~~TRINITY_DN3454_c0_g2_i1.p1  ORF type:complete len:409 (+),score=50.17 TRINITY_DN3454_c0_g2_i1:52-1227(+)